MDSFQELKGRGISLGLDESFNYEENVLAGISTGRIIAIGTDGLWEAHSRRGEMFGKARFRDILRRLAYMEAEKIVEAILDELKDFTTGVQPEDDIRLVVMRVKGETT